MKKLELMVRNTHFAVVANTRHQAAALISFNNNLVTYQTIYNPKTRKMTTKEDRRYYYRTTNNVHHYSVHLLKTFIARLGKGGIGKDEVVVTYDKDYSCREIGVKLQDHLEDRDHQPVYIKKVLETNPISLVDLKTGKGKTYISMRIATELKYPTGIVVLSRYIDKWVGDVKELTTATDDDIYIVQGRDTLIRLIQSNAGYDFVIFSLSTLRSYIKSYDETPELYGVAPEELFKVLGLKMMLNDEVHQSFHASYMTTIRLNPTKVLSLSATLDNLDHSISSMYATLYPKSARCGNLVTFEAYPIVIAINYPIDNADRLKVAGPRGYSHVMFEQNVLRHKPFRDMYLEMLLNYTSVGYADRRDEGDKLLILVQTVALATLLTNFLRSKLPKLTIHRYVEEDPYENIINADITVSTNLSAGTALDIPKLITVLQTVSMRSLQANIQALGRLREIKGKEVRYYYMYSSNIGKQHKLHIARKEVISHLAKRYVFVEYPKRFRY